MSFIFLSPAHSFDLGFENGPTDKAVKKFSYMKVVLLQMFLKAEAQQMKPTLATYWHMEDLATPLHVSRLGRRFS
ncbi:MAG: hypothetical protein ABSD99_07715 [Candidatus Bathyarchaeia archaeon]